MSINMEQFGKIGISELGMSPDKTSPDCYDFRLLTTASDEFDRCNYDSCLDILQQLEIISGHDVKILHNKAVAKFYKGNCMDYIDLLKQLEELEEEYVILKKDTTVTSLPCGIYNKAIIYYHRRMHKAAFKVMEPLFSKLDTYDESVLAVLGILQLRLLLASNQLKKGFLFLEVLLEKLGINIFHLSTDEFNAQEALSRLEGNVIKSIQLMSLLTYVVNKKAILIPENGSPEFSALKAHQHYIMKDFQMAAKQLKKISASVYMNGSYNQEMNTLIANNMGVIHLRVRNYAIAANFFQTALSFDEHISINLRNTELHYMSSAKSCEILYNLGITMLHLRRPTEAFQCFLLPLKTYHSNPRLWFRIAEACIMKHENKSSNNNKHFASNASRTFLNKISYIENSESSAVLEPTLPFAALTLRNALTLTRCYIYNLKASQREESIINTTKTLNWRTINDNNCCPPSRPITKQSFYVLLSSIYAAYSYVSLRLGDYVTALEMSEELLRTEPLSDAHKMLAHMYAGEALIMMDKLSDARSHLEPTFVSNLNTFDFETKDWKVKSLDAAQTLVRYNLAVAIFLQGDFDVARKLLNTCTHPIVSQKISAFKKNEANNSVHRNL